MSTLSNLVDCPDLQVPLDAAFGRPQNITEPLTFLEYLLSDAGRAGLRFQILPGSSKTRNVQVIYSQRYAESTVETNTPVPNCGTGDPYTELSRTYNIDTAANFSKTTTFGIADFINICRNTPDIIMDMLAKDLDVIDRRVATFLANQAVGLIGNWSSDTQNYNGTNVTNPNLLVATKISTATGFPDPTLYEVINRARMVTGYNAGVAFTDQTLWAYARNAATGCCVINQGVDLQAQLNQYGTVFAWDRRVQTALQTLNPDGNGLFVAPGALALIPFTLAQWKDGVNIPLNESGNYYLGGLFTRAGMPVDFTLQDACGVISMTVTASPHLFGMPTDMFADGDIYDGVVGVNKITISNPN